MPARSIWGACLVGYLSLTACSDLQKAAREIEDGLTQAQSLWRGNERDAEPAFYQYRNRAGRTVFVSDRSLVPAGIDAEPFDVSHIDLNSELGSELEAAALAEHEALRSSTHCTDANASPQTATSHVLRNERHWLGIGVAVLVLLVTAPWVARRVGWPRWIRTLALAIPLLLSLGILVHVLLSTRTALRATQETVALCDPQTMTDAESPEARASIVHRLRSQIEASHKHRERQVDAVLREAGHLEHQ